MLQIPTADQLRAQISKAPEEYTDALIEEVAKELKLAADDGMYQITVIFDDAAKYKEQKVSREQVQEFGGFIRAVLRPFFGYRRLFQKERFMELFESNGFVLKTEKKPDNEKGHNWYKIIISWEEDKK